MTLVVTGASSGLGAAVAKRFVRAKRKEAEGDEEGDGEGRFGPLSKVVLLGRNEERLLAVARECTMDGENGLVGPHVDRRGGGGRPRLVWDTPCVRAYLIDVGVAEEVARLPRALADWSTDATVLVNNAGIGDWKFLEQTEYSEIEAFIRVPYMAAAFATRAFLPRMLHHESELSTIVNITSIACFSAFPGCAVYQSARHGLRGLNDAVSSEMRGTHVAVRHVSLGSIADTAYFQTNSAGGGRDHFPAAARLFPDLTSDEAAGYVLDAIVGRDSEVIQPALTTRATIFVRALFPSLVDSLLSFPVRVGWRA